MVVIANAVYVTAFLIWNSARSDATKVITPKVKVFRHTNKSFVSTCIWRGM